MITMQEWEAMSGKEQTLWLEDNLPASDFSLAARKLVRGVGINDSSYITELKIEGERLPCPAYKSWNGMMRRTYSEEYHKLHKTYTGVIACGEWSSFMMFREWWMENQVDGWQLDKDLLSNAREYSPTTCLFVPQWLNKFTTDRRSARGAHPIGASFSKLSGRFQADCCNPITGKREHLGYFDTPEEAHLAWLKRKLELALELKPKMDEIDPRIYQRVCEIISNAK